MEILVSDDRTAKFPLYKPTNVPSLSVMLYPSKDAKEKASSSSGYDATRCQSKNSSSVKLLEKCANKKIKVESGYTQKYVDKSLEEK